MAVWLACALLVATGSSGCRTIRSFQATLDSSVQSTIASIDRAVAALAQQSADWQVVVQDLEKAVAADVQSTVRNEVTNLARNAVQSTGVEVRCNAEYMRLGLRRELLRMRNDLARSAGELFGASIHIVPELPVEPFLCASVPSAVDLALEPERRTHLDLYGFDLRSMPITVRLTTAGLFVPKASDAVVPFKVFQSELRQAGTVRGAKEIAAPSFKIEKPAFRFTREISAALSVVSDFHAVLDLTASGFELLPNALEIALSWGGRVRSEIAILTGQELAKCRVETRQWNKAGTDSQWFSPPAEEDHDKDFDGNGPCQSFDLRLETDATKRSLVAHYALDAWECNGDWEDEHDHTRAVGSGSRVLFSAQENETIIGFDVDSTLPTFKYRDTDHATDGYPIAGTAPVTRLEFAGDSKGDEAGSSTGVTMFFRPINVKVEVCDGG